MATSNISFSGRDYTAEAERLRQRALSLLAEWTDHNYSDPGEVLIALQATTTDLINACIDYYAQENFLDARFRQSLIDQGKKIGYLPTLASGATTRLRLTRIDGVTGALSIPKWSAFSRADGLQYCTASDATILAGSNYADVDAIQGTPITRTVSADDFAITDWTKRPKYNLGANVAADTVSLTHGSGDFVWTQSDTFWRVGSDDLVFLLELNGDNDTVWLVLGDGIRGQGPATSDMTVSFLQTAAAAGNCGTGTITLAPESLTDYITCSNIEMATGGAPSETRESLRLSLPDRTSIQRRGVIDTDYEGLIRDIPGVLHCNVLDRNTLTDWPHLYLAIFVVPEGGGPISSLLRQKILDECAAKGTLGPWNQRYQLFDAIEKPVSFVLRVGKAQGYEQAAVFSSIESALITFMSAENQEINGTVSYAELHSLIYSLPSVSWVEIDSPTGDVVCEPGEFPVYGSLGVTFQ